MSKSIDEVMEEVRNAELEKIKEAVHSHAEAIVKLQNKLEDICVDAVESGMTEMVALGLPPAICRITTVSSIIGVLAAVAGEAWSQRPEDPYRLVPDDMENMREYLHAGLLKYVMAKREKKMWQSEEPATSGTEPCETCECGAAECKTETPAEPEKTEAV